MDQYCVVVYGLLAGVSDEASAWLPVATALKLDQAEFGRRVVAALPRIVQRDVGLARAEHIAQVLQAMRVDARVLPDDPQLVYIDRAGTTRGPLPQCSLRDFIEPGESYRLHGSTTWQPWVALPDPSPAASATPGVAFDNVDAATSPDIRPTHADAEAQPTVSAAAPAPDENAASDPARQALPRSTGEEPRRAMPPPLPAPPAMGADASIQDDESINPPAGTATPGASDASTPAAGETTAPTRSRVGRLLVLLVFVVLAVWAYRHWMADARISGSPAAPAILQPPGPVDGQPATPAQAAPGQGSVPMPAAAASVSPATSVPAAATPATASSTPTPAETAAPPPVTAASAPATTTGTAAKVPAGPSGTLPASVGTVVSVQPAPAASVSAARPAMPATPAH